ncbi:MAG: GntR family transcriptional regulator [Tabrizicola sp.]|nr:GntR family transcriptional regulator [Tabrizicola sp.]
MMGSDVPEEKSSTHAQRALITLRKRILGGDLQGGTRLFEVALAEELGISRTPVRAALSRLAEEALLDRTPGGGFVVRSFAVRDVVDTIELVQNVDMDGYSILNAQFHRVLARLSQSDVLCREIERITALPFASPSAFLDDQTRQAELTKTLSAAQEQHRAMIEAIAQREGFRAESLAREHARAARRNVEFLLSQEAAMREGVASLAILSARGVSVYIFHA